MYLENKSDGFINGYETTDGAIYCILRWACFIFIIGCCLTFFVNSFNIGTDNSDKNGWNRSGFKILIDHKTGTEYLYRDGAIIKRVE